jgi:hypothetical protein
VHAAFFSPHVSVTNCFGSYPPAPGAPIPITSCDAVGCYDKQSGRYPSAGGNATLSPSGKLCNRTGAWLRCLYSGPPVRFSCWPPVFSLQLDWIDVYVNVKVPRYAPGKRPDGLFSLR